MNDMNFVLIEGNITEEPIIKSTCGGVRGQAGRSAPDAPGAAVF